MSQGILPFKYEVEKQESGMTALGGLGTYLDLAHASRLWRSIDRHMKVRAGRQGWTDGEVVMSLILLNLTGGGCVEDVERLQADEGFCRVLEKAVLYGLSRKQRRAMKRRWRKEKRRSVPSASSVFRYLEAFHDGEQEGLREQGKAFIPAPNGYLRGFMKVNRDFLRFMQGQEGQDIATLDMDARLVETGKEDALFCYQGYKAYQPLSTWWAEQGVVLHTEFRDGNVPAGFEQLRVLKEALGCLPEGVQEVRLRSDGAGYQHELLRYCEMGENERFGRIEFAISCPVGSDFKKAVGEVEDSEWKVLSKEVKGEEVETKRQWAEVCFVPNVIGHSKKGPDYRYIAIREPMQEQLCFAGMQGDEGSTEASMSMGGVRYRVFGIVSNMDWEGQKLIRWSYKRCGKSEEAHGVMKQDLAGGKLPSGDFGENAAWWWMMVLALNLNAAMKALVLGKGWISKRMKAIRFSLINLPARVMRRSRQLFVRISETDPCFEWLVHIRAKIVTLAPAPSG